ncbi:MAG: hypothetical protein KBH07_01985 [Flavobacteriales bacterium]|nr:hypothetical protein [Flavobacteriales bacterium]MBP9078892.1 hypothetical protein [Flavobacteriales bacterium]
MNELIHSLQESMDHLEQGKLGLEELERCVASAQAVYERLVVLRHKAREAAVTGGKPPGGAAAQETAPVAAEAGPAASIRLDTRPPEAHPQQTSLIDAIAETEQTAPPAPEGQPRPTPAPKPVAKAAPPAVERPATVADKLEQAPVADLRKAIALSQKFWFVAELFKGDRKQYEEAIDQLNKMERLAEAEAYVQQEVIAKLPEPPGEEVAKSFKDLLQRRFN